MLSIAREDLPRLLQRLRDDGRRLLGPTVRDGAIVYDEIAGADELPRGWTDEQGPGYYRLRRRDDDAYFGFVVGPHSWKRHLLPPTERLVRLRVREQAIEVEPEAAPSDPVALVGVRACEVAGMDVLDRVLTGGPFVDRRYARRREDAFVLAINCLEPGSLCFCASMGTGPQVEAGYDLCLTELPDRFLVEVGTPRGQAVIDALQTAPATSQDRRVLRIALGRSRERMGRSLQTDGLPGRLLGQLEHPRWAEVASRCLSCGNCTQVCPTCFCHAVDHGSTVGQEGSTTERRWESCFTDDHAYIHGGSLRPTVRDRYRQWLTHKLGSWVSQFGQSGCVGCGRCIAWCPAGIDLTEEAEAIAKDASVVAPVPEPPAIEAVAGDPMVPVVARVLANRREGADVFTLELEPPGPFRFRPGQFNMLSLPGIGEPPISIAGQRGSTILHTIRAVGAATRALGELRPGDTVGLRGPFGSAWPLEEARGHNVTVIAGGLGLAPLRGALARLAERPDLYPFVRLLYGARTPEDVLYDDQLLAWNRERPHMRVSVTVDHGTPQWNGHVGVVTTLMRRKELSPHTVYMVCGPEIMMRFVIDELMRAGVPEHQVYLSIERNMQCAAGLCGRCQYGPYFACKDGPVFRYDRVASLFHVQGF
ncbi:MAG: 4Fe-4S dicluster domain-containing protein [Myxococcales bacterium]|nr:4Fe-4S dicluster domain-containing protein [Myxococcales bacterium]